MNKDKALGLAAPAIMALLIYFSNFLDPNIFEFGSTNFALWFILSALSFACGWFVNKIFGWVQGGKLIFAVIIATTVVSLITVTAFSEYFGNGSIITEKIIVFTLRNAFLGAMGYFGMALCQVFLLDTQLQIAEEKLQVYEKTLSDIKKESDLILRDAQLQAAKMIAEADLQSKQIIQRKEKIERDLREFIQIEKELIKKYES